MARRILDENILLDRVYKMLPKGIPEEAIESVEVDLYGGVNGFNGYWVYLSDGYVSPDMECHTIHEDTLKELSLVVSGIEKWDDDPALKDHNGYTDY